MLVKDNLSINFAQGLDQKTDPKQVQPGKMLRLQNSIFDKGGLLQKRNGYGLLSSLPGSASYLTTFNGNLTAIGDAINAYSTASATWVSRGTMQPLQVSTLPLIRNSVNQIQSDAAVASNGLVCTVYTENNGSTTSYKYAISDSVTGQNIVAPRAIPVSSGTVTGSARVFLLGKYFIIVFTNVITATNHLQYIAISVNNPTIATANTDIASSYSPTSTLSWDGLLVNSRLYIAYNTLTGGQSIKMTYLTATLSLALAITFAGRKATIMTLAADIVNPASPLIYLSIYDSVSSTGYTAVVDQNMNVVTAPVETITTGTYLNLASTANAGIVTLYGEVANNYSYDAATPTHYISAVTMTQAGTVGSPYVMVRSVGLASKAFLLNGMAYFLAAYQSSYQPTYFLINATLSTAASPVVAGKLAYSNGGGYLTLGLPNVTLSGTSVQVSYLFKDLIAAVNKDTNVPTGTQTAGIYSQTGINLGTFNITTEGIDTTEIGNDLHISGGFLWMYDGYLPVEHNFFLWPDTDTTTPTDFASWSATGGSMQAQPDGATNTNAYFYQVTYEWTDNQGNAFRSAPSIPIAITTTGSASTGSVTLHIPTLRLTYKTPNPVKICVYRWSVGQQVYYQIPATYINSPLLNDTTIDSVTVVDTASDATILGDNILYTTGGVVEDVNAPASNIMTLFDTRLWLVDAEDKNLLWFSKQVIEATPVEMSDLFTIYVSPTIGAQHSTGPITALSVLDDKLIIFKNNAIYYINGKGPDNTGANNQYSEPIFVTSTVGCSNQNSIVFTPNGLMFQSNKGIWILGRDMSTSFIGSGVEDSTADTLVLSAVGVPATNQVRFTLDSGLTLMYDYYYNQWGTFAGIPGLSSAIFQELHTYINAAGQVYQETVDKYLDGSNPVLLSFTTAWMSLAGLQGFERAYFFYLLGTYISPHKLSVGVAYDFDPSIVQSILITPDNYNPPYGLEPGPYGTGTPYGGNSDAEQWRIFLTKQKCQSFQITINEVFDASFGTVAGAGLTLSGINLIVGLKKKYTTLKPSRSAS